MHGSGLFTLVVYTVLACSHWCVQGSGLLILVCAQFWFAHTGLCAQFWFVYTQVCTRFLFVYTGVYAQFWFAHTEVCARFWFAHTEVCAQFWFGRGTGWLGYHIGLDGQGLRKRSVHVSEDSWELRNSHDQIKYLFARMPNVLT